MTTEEFFKGLDQNISKKDDEIYYIFVRIDDMLRNEEFSKVDEILQKVDIDKYENTITISLLSITNAAKNNLENRVEFFNKLIDKFPDDQDLIGRFE